MRGDERFLRVGQCLIFIAAVTAAVASSTVEQWQPAELVVLLAGLTTLSGLFPLAVKGVQASGSFLGIVLVMALCGPAPAVAVGVAAIAVYGMVRRPPFRHLITNFACFAAFPLIGATAIQAADSAGLTEHTFTFSIAVFLVFLATNFINFLFVAVDLRVTQGVALRYSVREIYGPVMPVELASALLTASLAFGYMRVGISVVVLLVVAGLVFQYLLHLAFESMRRGEQLEGRTRELAALQVGLLSTVLKTLSLRDAMTARHSAAVARYAREIAREMGSDDREQDIVHTAALLHDIGKFVFPDSILFANRGLTDAEYEIVKTHPDRGAELVAQIEGYGPVAEIIRSHHERVDGRGYPQGLVGDQIPLAARIISVCDTYDVMTSRDSYRKPVTQEVAIAELERVSGTQLDGRVVAHFVRLLRERNIAFQHADDADFERELQLERRVRDYAAPRVAA